MNDLAALALALKVRDSGKRADPLASYRFASRAARDLVVFVAQRIEVLWRAANFAGKTYGGAALGVALAQMRTELDGVPLPRFERPPVGAVLSRTYKQQVRSVQAAYLLLLGDWPHEIGWLNRALGYIGTIRVRPIGWENDDPTSWSVIEFISQENGAANLGARRDWSHSDEPPVPEVWREERKNARYRWITFTPLDMIEWEPIRADFSRVEDRWAPEGGRVEVTSSLYDNAAVGEEDKARIVEGYEGDPFKDARIWGHYVNLAGSPIWDGHAINGLNHWLNECRDPQLLECWLRPTVKGGARTVELEVYYPPEKDEEYYAPADPSLGVEGGNPCGLHVYARFRPRLVARFRGLLPAQSLGHLAAKVGRAYNEALVDPETQGGWGEAVLVGLHEEGYGRIGVGMKIASGGRPETRFGFKTSSVTKGLYLAAAQESLGAASVEILSRQAVRSMLGAKRDKRGEIVFDDGSHGEDLILFSRACHWMAINPPTRRRGLLEQIENPVLKSFREAHVEAAQVETGQGDAWS